MYRKIIQTNVIDESDMNPYEGERSVLIDRVSPVVTPLGLRKNNGDIRIGIPHLNNETYAGDKSSLLSRRQPDISPVDLRKHNGNLKVGIYRKSNTNSSPSQNSRYILQNK